MGPARAQRLPPILCYHKVEPRLELGVTRLSPRRFARQIERLAAAGWRTLSLSELAACAAGRRLAQPLELAITFDDAYRGLRAHAFPVLAAHDYRAICSVITAYAGRLNRWDVAYGGRRFAHLAWRDLEHWSARGIEVASHTVTHRRLNWLSASDAAHELSQSRRDIAAALGLEAAAVSYPFAAAGARERRLAAEAGYTSGFVLATSRRDGPLAIPRLPVYVWSPPLPAVGPLRELERFGAHLANRCALGTTILQRQLPRIFAGERG